MKKHRKRRMRGYACDQASKSPQTVGIPPLKFRLILANLRCLVRMLEELLD